MGKHDALDDSREVIGDRGPAQLAPLQTHGVCLDTLTKISAAQDVERREFDRELAAVPIEEAEERGKTLQ